MPIVPLPHQPPVVERLCAIIRQRGAALDASCLGAGKTTTALLVAKELGLRPIIIGPKCSRSNWMHWLLESGMDGEFMHYEALRLGKAPHLCSLETDGRGRRFFRWYADRDRSLVIWDEAHALAGSGFGGSGAWSLQAKCGYAAAVAGYKQLFLSGTIADSPMKLRVVGAALRILRPEAGPFTDFCLRHGAVNGVNGWFMPRSRPLDSLHAVLSPAMVRLRTGDIAGWAGQQAGLEWIGVDDLAGFLTLQGEALAAARRLRAGERLEGEDHPTRILRRVELAKVPALAALAQQHIDEGRSVVILLNFRDPVLQLAGLLKTDCLVLGGQPEENQASVARLQSDRSRVLVGTMASGGQSLSMHDITGVHPRSLLTVPSMNPVIFRQTTGRCARAGSRSPTLLRICLVAGSPMDEGVGQSLLGKLDRLDSLHGDPEAGVDAVALDGVLE